MKLPGQWADIILSELRDLPKGISAERIRAFIADKVAQIQADAMAQQTFQSGHDFMD